MNYWIIVIEQALKDTVSYTLCCWIMPNYFVFPVCSLWKTFKGISCNFWLYLYECVRLCYFCCFSDNKKKGIAYLSLGPIII